MVALLQRLGSRLTKFFTLFANVSARKEKSIFIDPEATKILDFVKKELKI